MAAHVNTSAAQQECEIVRKRVQFCTEVPIRVHYCAFTRTILNICCGGGAGLAADRRHRTRRLQEGRFADSVARSLGYQTLTHKRDDRVI